ncbi:MAG TPA: ATP-binding protein [Steroidobacteraceae bacterium]|nr:ATP-binding protein [Steroidobacteraceae bacterium]
MRLSRLWPWIERTIARRYAFAAVMAVGAAVLHWAIFPMTQGRITFIFFIPAIVLVTTIAGRGPGGLVAVIGIVNSALMKEPGTIMIPNSAEQVAMISTALVSVLVIMVGGYYRGLSRREIKDVTDLHELSATLASVPNLPDQLKLILSTYVRMHDAASGLISTLDAAGGRLQLEASIGFGPKAIEELRARRGDDGACGLACVEGSRIVIEDTETDPRFAESRELARREHIRAVHATPLITRDGHVLGALTAHFSKPYSPSERDIRIADICARKATVFIERARAEEGVRQRDKRFQSVLEASGVPFLIWSPVRNGAGRIVDFRFVYVNTAAARVMRIRHDEYIGRNVLDTVPRAWDDPDRLQMYVDTIERNEVREMERHSAADGNVAWYHVIASPLDGDVAVWFADITKRKQQERELLEADRRKDEFLATLAHELRNPLAPIRQAAKILRNEGASEAQRRWANTVIERQVQHMSLLLDDLLDVSRITHGTLQLRKQQTDLQSIVSAAVETARPLIDERHHQLSLDVPVALEINADPLRLAQVLSNLLTNAAKYTNPNGSIRVGARQAGDELVVTVEDNGIGIASEDLGRVFGMFAQVRSAQDFAAGGLGIGLALAKGIVELHGGRIEASSGGTGHGSRFVVRLPNVVVAARTTPEVKVATNGQAEQPLRILLADDNRDAAESLAIILRLEGHEVNLAHDGQAALQAYAERKPDVALLDIGMPKTNGLDVARQIRAQPGGDDVLLVAITGWAQDSDKERSRSAGFDHHLTKPIEPEALIQLLARR